MQPRVWPKHIYNCAQVLDAQTPFDQANKKLKVSWCQSTNASTDFTQDQKKAANLSQSAKSGWRNKSKIKPTSKGHLSMQQTRYLSTTTCAIPTSTKLVDVMLQGNENVHSNLMLSTTNLKIYQQMPLTTRWRKLSTSSSTSDKHNDQPSKGSSGIVDQQLTDQPAVCKTITSANNSTETPQNDAASTGDKSRPPTPQPPDPETCCESGCANCVWIRYVQEMQEHAPPDREQLKKVLDLIEDHNVKMFVKMELGL